VYGVGVAVVPVRELERPEGDDDPAVVWNVNHLRENRRVDVGPGQDGRLLSLRGPEEADGVAAAARADTDLPVGGVVLVIAGG
jgi:hypothetical protein